MNFGFLLSPPKTIVQKILSLVVVLFCVCNSAAALQLGDVVVQSHLGQPLHVMIQVSDDNPQWSWKRPQVEFSPPQSAAKIPHHVQHHHIPADLKVSWRNTGKHRVWELHVHTTTPVQAPIIQIPIYCSLEGNTTAKVYTVLLDLAP